MLAEDMSSATQHSIDGPSQAPDHGCVGHRKSSSQGSDSDDSGSLEVLQRHNITLHEVLGRGMFGKVYKGLFRGMTVAIKLVELTAPRGQAKAQLTEAKIATSLQHPNVVHLHRAIVEQVRVMRRSLRSRSSVGSRTSSDWGEMQAPSKTYSWAAGADGALTPQGAMSPARLSPSCSAPCGDTAALSYNRIASVMAGQACSSYSDEGSGVQQPRSNSDVTALASMASGSSMAASPDTPDTFPLPPTSAFQIPPAPLPLSLGPNTPEPHAPPQPIGDPKAGQCTEMKEGEGRQSMGSGKSQSLVTFRCIFVMEFCDAGTLWAALQQGRYHDASGVPKLHAILATAIEVAEGVAYMHSHRVVHRDLTSGNILLMHEPVAQRVKAKVSDFGLSMLMKPGQDQALAMQHGTLAYMPPELIMDDAISFATDVYSFGILLWEMFSAKTPYMGMSEQQIIHRKVHEAVDMEPPPLAPLEIAELMQQCLNRQSAARPSFTAIKNSLHSLLAMFWSDE